MQRVGFEQVNDLSQLHRDGYILLRGVIPGAWLDQLRIDFDAGVKSADQWPVPRGADWRHAQLDLLENVQAACHLPQLLTVVGALIGERYFLAQVEGREPLLRGGYQALHRDLSAKRPGDTVIAIAYLDDFGPANGATRIVPGSHRPSDADVDFSDESQAIQISGSAGDVLVFDADLVHAGSCNLTGARRRSLLISYFAEPLYAGHLDSAELRGVRFAASWFDAQSDATR